MRTSHWITPLAICFLLTLSDVSEAQYPGMPGPTGINTAGLPPGAYQPYPTISPFERAYNHTANRGGLWFNDGSGLSMGATARNWTLNVDWISTKPRKLKGLVGAPNVTSYIDDDEVTPTDDGNETGINDVFDFFNYFDAANASNIGRVDGLGFKLSGGFETLNGPGFVFDVTYNPREKEIYNPKRDLRAQRYRIWDQPGLIGNPRANEEAVEFLLTNPDFLGVDISPPFDFVLDTPATNFQNQSENGLLQRNLYNLHGLPVVNQPEGQFDVGDFGGVTIPYDILFALEHRHESFNVGMGWAMSPIIETRGGFTVTPIVSGRYMYLGEEFIFRGIDSGMYYDGGGDLFKDHSRPDGVDDDGDKIVDNAGASDGDGGGGGGGGSFVGGDAAPTPAATFSLINPNGLIRSKLQNAVTTHLGGPEVAFRYSFGQGGPVNIYGQSKFGVMINRERLDLSGNNIGSLAYDQTIGFDNTAGATLTELFPTNGDQNRFSDEKISTHVSPLFEQTFSAEIPIFSQVPVLSRVRQLNGAKLRLGYSFLWIGEVASPNKSILWQANPQAGLFPEIRLNREAYYTNTVNVGLSWDF